MLAITLTQLALWSHVAESSLLVTDMTMSKMVELRTDDQLCALYIDRGDILAMVQNADRHKVLQMPEIPVAELQRSCKAWLVGKVQPAGSGLIYPGTYWCGSGHSARSYDELGRYAAEDACCREHDLCPKILGRNECFHGICNNSSYTGSHCDCDAKFRRCLQNVNSGLAKTIAYLFFNVLQIQCFKEIPPCSQWQSCPLEWKKAATFDLSVGDHMAKTVVIMKTIPEVAYQAVKKTIFEPLGRLFG